MYVRITSPLEDENAREMYDRFKSWGRCPFSVEKVPMGHLRDAKEDDGCYVLTVEITNPVAIEYIRQLQSV
jgi:hypothetical protein